MVRVRRAAVAGYFYESNKDELIKQIKWAVDHELGPREVIKGAREGFIGIPTVVTPHAGYVYSGPVAAHSFTEIYRFHEPKTFVIAGPNHYGVGAPVAVMEEGIWETPFGRVEIDSEVVKELRKYCRMLEIDYYALEKEHSVEVQIPFIQYFFKKFKIVPIALWLQSIEVARCLGKAIAEIVKKVGIGEIVYIASTDWNHYEPHEVTTEKDMKAIDKVLKLDLEGFYEIISKLDISVCGYGAVGTAIVMARELGIKTVKLLKHATSGDTSGHFLETVGYASLIFYV